MTYLQFIEEIKSLPSSHQLERKGIYHKSPRGYYYTGQWEKIPIGTKNDKLTNSKFVITEEWSTGGITGGSCWDDGRANYQSYTSDNSPAELTLLDEILEHFKPDITFLQYKMLTQQLVEHSSPSGDEYYGNSTNYASKTIELEKLYNYIKEKSWLPA